MSDILTSNRRVVGSGTSYNRGNVLYGEDAISAKDYLTERKRMIDELVAINAQIETLEKDRSGHFSITDDDFIAKASYFLVSQSLTERREVNYEKYIREIDPRILKDFLGQVVQNFCIKDGRIESISFKNGVEHRFLYKGDDE